MPSEQDEKQADFQTMYAMLKVHSANQAKEIEILKECLATPPADAALADELDSVASELATYQSDNAATVSRAAAALRARAVPEGDVIEKIEEYGGHRENEGGSYATFQKSEARRYRAEADEVLSEIRALLAASKGGAV